MSGKEKLIAKLKANKGSFEINELDTLLTQLGYKLDNKGRTSGSRIQYISPGRQHIVLHKPHHGNELKDYQKKQIISVLEQEGLL